MKTSTETRNKTMEELSDEMLLETVNPRPGSIARCAEIYRKMNEARLHQPTRKAP